MIGCGSCPESTRGLVHVSLACVVVLATSVIGGRQASAAPTKLPAASSQMADRSAYVKARDHIRRGDEHYDARRFQAAIDQYQAAYRLLPLPDLLFNIAQAHRLAGDLPAAATYYTRYLELPDGKARSAARRQLDRLRQQLPPTRDRPTAPRSSPSIASVSHPRSPTAGMDAPAPRRRWLGPVLTASGLAITALGAGLAISARVAYNDLQDACAPTCARSSWDGLPARHTAGTVLGVVGAATTLGGAVLWILTSRRPARAALTLTPAGVSVRVALRF